MFKKTDTKRGFTDRMYIYNLIFVTLTVITSFVAVFMSGFLNITDLSPLGYIISSAFAELGIHTGFIIWKAKAENVRKYGDKNVENLEDI